MAKPGWRQCAQCGRDVYEHNGYQTRNGICVGCAGLTCPQCGETASDYRARPCLTCTRNEHTPKLVAAAAQANARRWVAPEALIDEIQLAGIRLGRAPTMSEFGGRKYSVIKRFGSWNKGLMAAGFPSRAQGENPTTATASGRKHHGRNRQMVAASDKRDQMPGTIKHFGRP